MRRSYGTKNLPIRHPMSRSPSMNVDVVEARTRESSKLLKHEHGGDQLSRQHRPLQQRPARKRMVQQHKQLPARTTKAYQQMTLAMPGFIARACEKRLEEEFGSWQGGIAWFCLGRKACRKYREDALGLQCAAAAAYARC